MKLIYTDVLVIGGGLAGMRTAIGVKRRGLDTLVLSLVPAKRSHSVAAQGGMQASLANCVKAAGDNEDIHFQDTVRGSDWGCDQQVARMFTHMAPKAVRELAAWGVPWNRVRKGEHEVVINGQRVTLTAPAKAHGLITARDFGGTKKWRTCYTSDGTGHAMLYTLGDQAVAASIPVEERKEAMALIHDQGRCYGAVVRDLISGELSAYLAKATVMATGGYGRIYGVSTNAIINEGIGQALALETGVARLANMEAVQFHPTAIVPAGILVTEGCRGDGGLLRDKDGHRFMPDYEPDKKELASRDVVSRRMAEHMRKGKGVASPYGDHLWLDITVLGEAHINKNLREVKDICQYFLGIDPSKEWIPVRPTQHYSMGGIRTDYRGESPWLSGLFACGEVACWDMHGFNRLGGNSVAETVVSGMLVSEYIADFCQKPENDLTVSTHLAAEFLQRETDKLKRLFTSSGDENAVAIRKRMEQILMEKVGLFRNGEHLREAVEELQQLLIRSRQISVASQAQGANPELVLAYRLPRMLKIAIGIALGALQRTESRGAHYREDHPERNDRDWLNRTLCHWNSEDDTLPVLDYEPLDVNTMELPPGFRGYGTKNIIEHPATEARQTQVDRITEAAPSDLNEQLMPFRHLLPEKYRGDNERLEDSNP
ncbi:MAG: fumarate reductase flavoprotein subunit [Sedimenticola sp.]|nr:MAG: fumarate reductase flavoprotein subunit [Sedimenticola sp.]